MDEQLNVWILEVNVSPDVSHSTKVTAALVPEATKDTLDGECTASHRRFICYCIGFLTFTWLHARSVVLLCEQTAAKDKVGGWTHFPIQEVDTMPSTLEEAIAVS